MALVTAAIAWTVRLIVVMTRLPLPVVLGALAVSDLYICCPLGQVVPIIAAVMVTAVWFMQHDRPFAAACTALVALIEPNLGGPFCLALFCIERRSRATLLTGGVLCILLSLWLAPASVNLEYLRSTLPGHAASEVHNDYQLSVTHLVSLAGAPDRAALAVGSISTVVL